jgi:hypothetical protein
MNIDQMLKEVANNKAIKDLDAETLFYTLKGIYVKGFEDGESKGKNEFKEKMIKTIKSI